MEAAVGREPAHSNDSARLRLTTSGDVGPAPRDRSSRRCPRGDTAKQCSPRPAAPRLRSRSSLRLKAVVASHAGSLERPPRRRGLLLEQGVQTASSSAEPPTPATSSSATPFTSHRAQRSSARKTRMVRTAIGNGVLGNYREQLERHPKKSKHARGSSDST